MPGDSELGRALRENRRRIVTRVLGRCGFRVDSDTARLQTTATTERDFAATERALIRSGAVRPGPSRRSAQRLRRHCPSRWSIDYWVGRWRHLRR